MYIICIVCDMYSVHVLGILCHLNGRITVYARSRRGATIDVDDTIKTAITFAFVHKLSKSRQHTCADGLTGLSRMIFEVLVVRLEGDMLKITHKGIRCAAKDRLANRLELEE